MRFVGTAWPAMVSTLAGCSLLYNPNNLPQPKADAGPESDGTADAADVVDAIPIDAAPPPDMPTDTNIANPVVTEIGPKVLFEGQGTGGSRRAILAIVGGNFGPDATVSIDPTSGPDPTILIDVDNANIVRSPSGTALAVPITLPVDAAHGSPTAKDVPLTVTVMQAGASPLLTSGKVLLRNLPELTAPITSMSSPPILYSQVIVATPIVFAASTSAKPAVIRAVGSISVGDVHADASISTPGPGGGAGGANTGDGGGPAGGKASTLTSSGSGGGYGTGGAAGSGLTPVAGGGTSGDSLISAYATNQSSGGGGAGALSGGGGGGGGTLEVTAGGTLTIGKVSANGAGASGGSGSGGAIVLRAGALAKLNGDISAAGGTANASGGMGRLRFDAPARMGSPAMTAVTHVGASFDIATGANPLVTTDSHQLLHLLGESSSAVWTMSVVNAQGSTTSSQTFTFGSSSATVTPALNFGYNRICVSPPMGDPSILESSNCIDLAYVP